MKREDKKPKEKAEKGEKKEEKKGKTSVHFVKVKALADFARALATFGEGTHAAYAVKDGQWYRIFALGLKIGDIRLAYYTESKAIGSMLVYQPGTTMGPESAEIKNITSPVSNQRGAQNMPIIELARNPYVDGGEKAKVKAVMVRIKNCDAVIRGLITKSLENNTIGRVYCFKYGGKTYIGSFILLEDDDDKMFCYAECPDGKEFSFFRYNYTTDKVEPTEVFGEHSYLYVRVINLAEPFNFFKPE